VLIGVDAVAQRPESGLHVPDVLTSDPGSHRSHDVIVRSGWVRGETE
jgi:hypothetical protein